ncbi:uncharacterized protein K452DRAFT_162110 [Aplosporella prunicola CBS 121167]|uniref:Secreted peptide n=1 Tax=Aplosporella prunicola CBS 121167 TaxID=1176127 RepID=A0A6A6BMI7_9PEZI|nr:uncharacterized protein K452DRAFT_162110 [Aplosporella prunicola CBS 121167]KAF2143771.1 hypothetical protein K452DRAFT_162110 [Aplosporella prunicola CBS 121167]
MRRNRFVLLLSLLLLLFIWVDYLYQAGATEWRVDRQTQTDTHDDDVDDLMDAHVCMCVGMHMTVQHNALLKWLIFRFFVFIFFFVLRLTWLDDTTQHSTAQQAWLACLLASYEYSTRDRHRHRLT